MNSHNATVTSTRQQTTALGFAALVTLSMLGGINLLATQGGTEAQRAAAQLQQQQQQQALAACAAGTAKGG